MWSVIGQESTVSYLKQCLSKGLLGHAYIIIGPPHIGKMTMARLLAQALNCISMDPPCGICNPCQKIMAGTHSDVQVIHILNEKEDPEGIKRTEITTRQVEDVQKMAATPPFEGKCKVFIFDQAERLSEEAANRLLKILEEPPPEVVFIFLASNENRVLPTILSRCQRLELLPLPNAEIEKVLRNEKHLPEPQAKLLARLCHGCPGWAINAAEDESILQQRNEDLDNLIEFIESGY